MDITAPELEYLQKSQNNLFTNVYSYGIIG